MFGMGMQELGIVWTIESLIFEPGRLPNFGSSLVVPEQIMINM